MLNSGILLAAILAFSTFSLGQASTTAAASAGFSVDDIDKSVDPCVDFYQYACGNWMKRAEIPADESDWVSFLEVNERNQKLLRDILEKAAAGGANRDAVDQKLGDYYGACMDEHAADAKGL